MNENTVTPVRSERVFHRTGFIIVTFFFLICFSIVAIWFRNTIIFPHNGNSIGVDIIIPFAVIALLSTLAVGTAIGSATLLWGRKHYYNGFAASQLSMNSGVSASEVSVISLWGMPLYKECFGRRQDIIPNPLPDTLTDTAWSHLAFDSHSIAGSDTIANDILEAALWQLIATGIIKTSSRRESKQLLHFWFQRNTLNVYCSLHQQTTPPQAYWELKFAKTLYDQTKPLAVYNLVTQTFGEKVASTPKAIVKPIHSEYEAMGIGSAHGFIKIKFTYADTNRQVRNAPHWQMIKDYIKAHDSNGEWISTCIRDNIRKAMINMENSGD